MMDGRTAVAKPSNLESSRNAAAPSSVGARIDWRLCLSRLACAAAGPGGDRHTETCHSVEHVAPAFASIR
jgi:hypothetical protein